ncbi:MAG: sodium:solute symporter [Phycisphaerae bacterium]
MPEFQSKLVLADYLLIGAYFVVTMGLGLWSALKARTSSRGFFVAEKTLPWWVIGLTMVAASISAEQMLGEVGYARDAGIVVSNWDLGVFPALVLMIFVFLPLYLRSGITTIPEYLERRYGRTTRLLFAVYTVFNNACITLVMVLALGATALRHFIGLDPRWGAVILIAFTGIYTVAGGMLAVAWTQTLQCVLLLAGGLTITFAGLSQVPGGLAGLFDRMAEADLDHLVRPVSDPYVPWPGLVLLMLSTNVWYCCTNQFYVQSCLGARDERHGRLGVLLTAFLAPVLTLCFAFPGYIARDLAEQKVLPAMSDANATYPHLVLELLGPGLRGFLIAAVLGAIMSSIAAIVNATASVFTNDLYQRWFRPAAADRELIRTGRIVGLATLMIAYPLTLVAAQYNYIFVYSQNAWSILAIPIMLVFTFGALWKRTTNVAATAVFLFIAPFVAVPFLFGNTNDNYLDLPLVAGKVHLFNFAFVLWLAAAAFMLVISLLTPPADRIAVDPYVFDRKLLLAAEAAGCPWYRRVGFWTAVAGAMLLGIYVVLW